MSDVLLAFVHEDAARAHALAEMFDAAGFTIGDAHADDDEFEASAARVIVWSAAPSVESPAFLAAAQRFMDTGDAIVASLMETTVSHIGDAPVFDLSEWRGRVDDPVLDPLFFAVHHKVMAARAEAAEPVLQAPEPACLPARVIQLTAPTQDYVEPAATTIMAEVVDETQFIAEAPLLAEAAVLEPETSLLFGEAPAPEAAPLVAEMVVLEPETAPLFGEAPAPEAAPLVEPLIARAAETESLPHYPGLPEKTYQRLAAPWSASVPTAPIRPLQDLAPRAPAPALLRRNGRKSKRQATRKASRPPAARPTRQPARRRNPVPALLLGALVVGLVLTANLQFGSESSHEAVVSGYVTPQQAQAAPAAAAVEQVALPDAAAPRALVRAKLEHDSPEATPVLTRISYVAPPVRSWEQHKQFDLAAPAPLISDETTIQLIPIKLLMNGGAGQGANQPQPEVIAMLTSADGGR